jgi:osmotically-inducible protein OsmY
LPPSKGDEDLRRIIAYQLFASDHFERFASQSNPPFHIVVHNSVVTLYGVVQSEIEYREMERIIRQTEGVLRVQNKLQKAT